MRLQEFAAKVRETVPGVFWIEINYYPGHARRCYARIKINKVRKNVIPRLSPCELSLTGAPWMKKGEAFPDCMILSEASTPNRAVWALIRLIRGGTLEVREIKDLKRTLRFRVPSDLKP